MQRTYFHLFDIFIMPSRSEGLGLTLIEAVQQKVPVICSDIEVFKELFNKEEVTFFKLDNKNSLTDALHEVNESGSKKATLAYSGFKNKYAAKLMAEHYGELYHSAS